MVTLILGGAASGKSEYAETRAQMASPGKMLYYLATMKAHGEDNLERIARHRNLRNGKGFETIEQDTRIEDCLDKIPHPETSVVLLECMSNLAANEMFKDGAMDDYMDVKRRIMNGISKVAGSISNLVIVTNNIFEDGIIYDDATKTYIKLLGEINSELMTMADEAVEVIYGIPVYMKKYEEN